MITDSFTGTNGTELSAYNSNWSKMWGGSVNIDIQSNGFVADAAGVAAYRNAGENPGDDHYAQVTLEATNQFDFAGPAVRLSAASSGSGYYLLLDANNGTIYLYKRVNGTVTEIASNGSPSYTVGQVIKLEVSGTTLTPTVNGATPTGFSATYTDSAIATGYPGIAYDYSSGGATRGDNYQSAAVGGGGGSSTVGALVGGGLVNKASLVGRSLIHTAYQKVSNLFVPDRRILVPVGIQL